ncbi:GyrI-like domain-containing protein [Streptosporangiaceae bacterium NEAU-GS5]|nr:GyrI-like domain-containing protein [Streptosporangiaceae bacterium NEAU-GS5]
MNDEPRIVEREAQAFAGIVGDVTMDTIPEIADRLGEVFGRLTAQGMEPVAAPFFKYELIDMPRLRIVAGFPIAEPEAGLPERDGDVFFDTLPAGRYVTVAHTGHPQELEAVTGELLAWAAERGLSWDMTPTPEGERWGCRLEIYQTDPRVEPDMSKWTTDLAFRLES